MPIIYSDVSFTIFACCNYFMSFVPVISQDKVLSNLSILHTDK